MDFTVRNHHMLKACGCELCSIPSPQHTAVPRQIQINILEFLLKKNVLYQASNIMQIAAYTLFCPCSVRTTWLCFLFRSHNKCEPIIKPCVLWALHPKPNCWPLVNPAVWALPSLPSGEPNVSSYQNSGDKVCAFILHLFPVGTVEDAITRNSGSFCQNICLILGIGF